LTHTLIVDTKTPATEITVINASGRAIVRGVSKLVAKLEPALYKIRYRVGDQVVDQLVELPEQEPELNVEVPALPILSAAPLRDSGPDFEVMQELLTRRGPDPTKPSSIFLFVISDPESTEHPSDFPLSPGSGISIHKFSGEKVGDMGGARVQQGCCGVTFHVDPGRYILRIENPPGAPVEQTLVAIDGWQVQFYGRLVRKIAATSNDTDRFTWQLDTTRSGVLLIEEPATELPSDHVMRITAAARQALAAGRAVSAPDPEMIDQLLEEKFKNPMLGIYAGHLMAMQDPVNNDLLRRVVNRLTGLVGDHPDVTALLIPLKDPRAETLVYNEPPMLRRSWSIIVNASTPERDLRPPRSYAARIGASLWGSGAWLAWRKPPELESPARSADSLTALLASAISGELASAVLKLINTSDPKPKLTPDESAVARYLAVASAQVRQAKQFTEEDDQKSTLGFVYPIVRWFADSELLRDTKQALSPAQMTKTTGLPYSTILDAAASLSSKLGLDKGASVVSQLFASLKLK